MLPLVPPEQEYWSPYSGTNASCGNELLISVDRLVAWGLVTQSDADALAAQIASDARWKWKCDFDAAVKAKMPLLEKAADALLKLDGESELGKQFELFKSDPLTQSWLPDAAIFDAIQSMPENHKVDWWEWQDESLRNRDKSALAKVASENEERIARFEAVQFLFHAAWLELKEYANARGVKLLGDIPIYVGGNSADVWANRELFEMENVSGVPPDAFSDDGQLWGSPLFDWAAQKKSGFVWWRRRIERLLELHDMVRIDHFRAFAGYWSVPADSETAKSGKWRQGPGEAFFDALKDVLPASKLVAEDLGIITDDVNSLRAHIGAPGMVVLQFAFGGGGNGNTHLPHNYEVNSVVYTGTHDNETTLGWYRGQPEEVKKYVSQYLDDGAGSLTKTKPLEEKDATRRLMGLAMQCASRTAIVPAQDLLLLTNDEGRMNTPGVAVGNWAYRVDGGVDALRKASVDWMAETLPLYRRGKPRPKPDDLLTPYESPKEVSDDKTEKKSSNEKSGNGWLSRLFGLGK